MQFLDDPNSKSFKVKTYGNQTSKNFQRYKVEENGDPNNCIKIRLEIEKKMKQPNEVTKWKAISINTPNFFVKKYEVFGGKNTKIKEKNTR